MDKVKEKWDRTKDEPSEHEMNSYEQQIYNGLMKELRHKKVTAVAAEDKKERLIDSSDEEEGGDIVDLKRYDAINERDGSIEVESTKETAEENKEENEEEE